MAKLKPMKTTNLLLLCSMSTLAENLFHTASQTCLQSAVSVLVWQHTFSFWYRKKSFWLLYISLTQSHLSLVALSPGWIDAKLHWKNLVLVYRKASTNNDQTPTYKDAPHRF